MAKSFFSVEGDDSFAEFLARCDRAGKFPILPAEESGHLLFV
jgi:hypothetical protein